MKKNMGNIDRITRSLVAVLIISLYFTGIIHGVAGTALMALALIFLVTSIFAFCPIYKLFGIHTCRLGKS